MKITEENYIKYMKKGNDKALDYFILNHGWIIKSIIVKKMSRFPNVQEECMNDVFCSME
ncbi:MAG: hypothetical protein PUE01_04000 [Clostridiaceae bacterium]|nr:hypothetical protein [Clostridiaceae bacterium]